MFVYVKNNGSIELPEEIKKEFPMYISFFINNGDIVMRIPKVNDKWDDWKEQEDFS